MGLADTDCEGVAMALEVTVPVAVREGVEFWVAVMVCERDEA